MHKYYQEKKIGDIRIFCIFVNITLENWGFKDLNTSASEHDHYKWSYAKACHSLKKSRLRRLYSQILSNIMSYFYGRYRIWVGFTFIRVHVVLHVAWKHAFFSSLYTHELISSNGISSLPVRCVKHELISSNGISSLPVRCAKHALISSMESLAYQPKHEILFITSFENSPI